MFESNFPVDKVSFSHPVLYNAFKRFSKSYSPTERAAMLHDTAVKAYRISYRLTPSPARQARSTTELSRDLVGRHRLRTIHLTAWGGAAMPYGGNDWLALTQEEILEPELPICDPHHHFWDKRPERIPYQRYLLPELLADVNQGHNVRSTVFIEPRAMYRPIRAGREAAGGRGRVRAGPGRDEREWDLRAHAGSSVHHRACRPQAGRPGRAGPGGAPGRQPEPLPGHSPHASPGTRTPRSAIARPRASWRPMGTAPARACWPRWASRSTLTCRFPQLPELADFARAVPDLPIILNHIGGLQRTGA